MRTKHSFVRMAKVAAAVSVVASVALSSGVAEAASTNAKQPAAATKIRFKASIVAPAPASDFTFTGGGDGWDLAFSSTQFFNAYHHDGNFNIDCHLKATGDVCSGFPATIFDENGLGFTTSGQPALYYQESTRHIFSYSVRQDGVVGMLCVDPATSSKYCGFTSYGTASMGSMAVSNGVVIGSKDYAFVHAPGYPASTSGADNKVLCYDLEAHAACSTPMSEVAIPQDYGSGTWPAPSISAIAGRVMINVSEWAGVVTCFDPVAMATCSGNWPTYSLAGNNGSSPMPVLNSTGAAIGWCQQGTSDCLDFSANAISVPSAITSAVPAGTPWQGPSLTIGTKVYLPVGGYDAVYCVDFATGDVCPNYPVSVAQRGVNYLYTIGYDKSSPSCLWVSADSGNHKITNFDIDTGGKCGAAGATIAEGDVVAPSLACTDVTWDGLVMFDPKGGTFDGGKVTIKDSSGNPSGLPDQTFGSDGLVDLSGVASQMPDAPRFTIELTNPVDVKQLTVEFDWLGAGLDTCVVPPSAPGPTITGDLGTRALHVTWLPPMKDGVARNPLNVHGSNVSNYVATVTGPDGEKYVCKTTSLSCNLKSRKVLRSGQTYSVSVVAVSNAGKSEPGTASTSLNGEPSAPVLQQVAPLVGGARLQYATSADFGNVYCCDYFTQYREVGASSWSQSQSGWNWHDQANQRQTDEISPLDPSLTYEVRVALVYYDQNENSHYKYSNVMTVNPVSSSITPPSVSGVAGTGVVVASAKAQGKDELPVTSYLFIATDDSNNFLGQCVAESSPPGAPLPVGTCTISLNAEPVGPLTVYGRSDNGVETSDYASAPVLVVTGATATKRGQVGEFFKYKVASRSAKLGIGGLPPGLSLSKGILSGTPTVATKADQPYIFSISGGGETTTYTMVVDPAKVALSAPKDALLIVGEPLQPWMAFGPADATAPELDFYLSSSSGPLPNGVTLSGNGELTGTPTESGAFPIEVCANDLATGTSYTGCATYTITIGTIDGSGQFALPTINWEFHGKASGSTSAGKQVLNLTPDAANVGGSAVLPIPLNVTDFTVGATLDFGADGDGIALGLVDPSITDLLGSAGGQLGLNGLVGSAVTWDTHQNKNNGDPSNNFMGIATQRAQGKFTYAGTKVLPRSGSTLLTGTHAVSAHFEQVGDHWHVTSVLDGTETLEADIAPDAINPTSLLVFTSTNGAHFGAHSATDVVITTPTNTAACQVRRASAPLKVYTSLQEAADAANWGDTLAVAGTCGSLNTGMPLTIGGIGQNASIEGSVTLGNGQSWTLSSLHLVNPDGAALVQYDGDLTLNNVTVSDSVEGIYQNAGTLTLNNSQVLNNGKIPFQYHVCGGMDLHGQTYLNNSLVSGNESQGGEYGGGICLFNASLYSNGSIISHNTATGSDGGGIYALSSWVQLRGTTLAHNSTSGRGGGLFAAWSGGDLGNSGDASQRNRFYQNTAATSGGGMYLTSGFGICQRDGAPDFVGNTDSSTGGFITKAYGGTVSTGSRDAVADDGYYLGDGAIQLLWWHCD